MITTSLPTCLSGGLAPLQVGLVRSQGMAAGVGGWDDVLSRGKKVEGERTVGSIGDAGRQKGGPRDSPSRCSSTELG